MSATLRKTQLNEKLMRTGHSQFCGRCGCKLPHLNDDFTGKAPDLSALEAGKPLPVYGPRQ